LNISLLISLLLIVVCFKKMRKNERYERFLSRVSKKRKKLFCLGFWSERSLFDSSEQRDDKRKRIRVVKRKLSLRKTTREYIIKVFSRNQRERREERTHRREREIERAVLVSHIIIISLRI